MRDEYTYYVDNEEISPDMLTILGLTNFQAGLSFYDDRVAWVDNSRILAERLTSASGVCWLDIMVLQLLFSRQSQPVFFAPVYPLLGTNDADDPFPFYSTIHVPDIKHVAQMLDGPLAPPPHQFTVVPLMPLFTNTFGYFSVPAIPTGINDQQLLDEITAYR